jgi:hypothetical protein
MIALIPPVVGHLVTAVRVHHGEEHLSDLDGIVLHDFASSTSVNEPTMTPR